MLCYEHLHKQVRYYQSLTGGMPPRVYVYVQNENYAFRLIAEEDFKQYAFVAYTYAESFYPVVKLINPELCLSKKILMH